MWVVKYQVKLFRDSFTLKWIITTQCKYAWDVLNLSGSTTLELEFRKSYEREHSYHKIQWTGLLVMSLQTWNRVKQMIVKTTLSGSTQMLEQLELVIGMPDSLLHHLVIMDWDLTLINTKVRHQNLGRRKKMTFWWRL